MRKVVSSVARSRYRRHMGLNNQYGKIEGFDVILILLMLFLLFGISLSIA
jgi:hypothetical protein